MLLPKELQLTLGSRLSVLEVVVELAVEPKVMLTFVVEDTSFSCTSFRTSPNVRVIFGATAETVV